jgi:hypothetical protein
VALHPDHAQRPAGSGDHERDGLLSTELAGCCRDIR